MCDAEPLTKTEAAIEALKSLPPQRQEELAEIVLELANASDNRAMTDEQLEEVRRRRAAGFQPADPSRLAALRKRFS